MNRHERRAAKARAKRRPPLGGGMFIAEEDRFERATEIAFKANDIGIGALMKVLMDRADPVTGEIELPDEELAALVTKEIPRLVAYIGDRRVIRGRVNATIGQIAKDMGLSFAEVAARTGELIAAGLLEERAEGGFDLIMEVTASEIEGANDNDNQKGNEEQP